MLTAQGASVGLSFVFAMSITALACQHLRVEVQVPVTTPQLPELQVVWKPPT